MGYYSGWAEQFPSSFAREAPQPSPIPYVQIDPTYATVSADRRRRLRCLPADLRRQRPGLRSRRGHRLRARDERSLVLMGIPQHVPPATFVAAWRHIVTLFRDEGADNVTWLWTVNQWTPDGTGPIAAWWPGQGYVTWVGIDGYYVQVRVTLSATSSAAPSARCEGSPRTRSCCPRPPWALRSDRFANDRDLFNDCASTRLLGVVWFDCRSDHWGPTSQNWRIEGNPPAENAFRLRRVPDLNLVRAVDRARACSLLTDLIGVSGRRGARAARRGSGPGP